MTRFHSISFPSEWGPDCGGYLYSSLRVSIQLVSPASGDAQQRMIHLHGILVSIQLVSPASGDLF